MSDPKEITAPVHPVPAAGENARVATEHDDAAAGSADEAPDSSPGAMQALLKRALAEPPADTGEEILRGVQQKIRKRSRGKFYGDGWSTNQSRVSYALVAVLMLLLLGLAYWFISPLAVGH